MNWGSAKPIHRDPDNPMKSVFKVEKATEEQIAQMKVMSWPTWSTAGSTKYKVGIVGPLKVYDTNELSYIISGKMEIIPEETGAPVLVEAGDFVTFPDEFPCRWHVLEEINKVRRTTEPATWASLLALPICCIPGHPLVLYTL